MKDKDWWKKAVIYQIYPRSFYDSNHDGIGDLEGIIQKLDYLNNGTEDSLGIDAIWLSPIYPSPMHDFGYDISDYEGIDPVFGNISSFKKLLKEAHKRKIKIIMDLVVNHTSHMHPWFIESSNSKTNPRADWYIWKDPGPDGEPPNNWKGVFGGGAWEWNEKRQQYYYHSFLVEQPDLNWRNPQVKKEIFKMIRYWLDMGVDGFRLDVVNLYIKDKQWRDNPIYKWRFIARPYDRQNHIYDRDQPEMHKILKEFRSLLDSYGGKMSVGEVMMEPPGTTRLPASYYGDKSDELHMAFNFQFFHCWWGAHRFRRAIRNWVEALKPNDWPNYTLSNHDFSRHISRYSWKDQTEKRARLAALMLLSLRGTPFLYYGEEIGMKDQRVPRKLIQDPVGKRYWPFHWGRDPVRIPMCWNRDKNGGFTSGEAWLPIYKDYQTTNVEAEEKDPASLLNFYKKLIWIRKKNPVLQLGEMQLLESGGKEILAYLRKYKKESALVVLNFTNKPIRFEPGLQGSGKLIISTLKDHKPGTEVEMSWMYLQPLEGIVIGF